MGKRRKCASSFKIGEHIVSKLAFSEKFNCSDKVVSIHNVFVNHALPTHDMEMSGMKTIRYLHGKYKILCFKWCNFSFIQVAINVHLIIMECLHPHLTEDEEVATKEMLKSCPPFYGCPF